MKQEERSNNIDTIISRVNEAITTTRNKWEAMSSSIPSAKTLDKDILPQIMQSLSSLSSIDTALKRNHYYGRLLSLTTKKTETLSEEVINKLSLWKVFTNIARNIVESMYKAEMFDGFGDDDLFKSHNSSVDNFCNTLFDEPSQLICEYLQKPWLEDRINIGLFGKYTSGKTTILNCLYGENFPTNNAENTAVPTYLYHGQDSQNLILVDVKGKYTKINEEEAAVLDTSLSESFPFYQLYEYIAKQNPSVPEKLTIIDAPGVMGRNSDVPVLNAIKQCDIVVWLLDIRGSLSKGELDFIKAQVSKPLFVVLTYTDRLDDNGYNQALSDIAAGFKKAEVDVKGFVRYNKYEENSFRAEFKKTIGVGISQFEIVPKSPYSIINIGISYIRFILKANEEYYTNKKNEFNNEFSKTINNIQVSYGRMADKLNILISRINQLVEHNNNNLFAGNAFTRKINSVVESIDYVTDAWNQFDIGAVVESTKNSINKVEAEDKLQIIEDLKEYFENSIGKLFKE